jgi:hypothetical protein
MNNQSKPFDWADYFSFKSMIALRIIQILYIIGAVGTTLAGLYWLFAGDGAIGHLMGLLILVLGNVFWRVWCELLIIFFRMNQTLNSIEDNTRKI